MESIGKYQIVEKVGEGGFGVIYKGYDPFIKRPVAVKTCTSEAEDIRSRFFHEAQIAGNLQHRNITTVYDFGVVDEVPFLVQEFLSGEDLDRKIKRKEFLPYPEKLLYLVQIARGLEFAHSRGVIHRDIKPANIRILEDGTAKIMDFGIAKLAQQESGLTQTGMTLGTAAYLAPEQVRGEPVDQRTDIFSYGLLAYELLTYARPFSGQQISTLLFQILNEEPRPLIERWPGCPAELAAIVNRCLQKEPARRYPSMTDLLRDLEALLKRRRAHDGTDSGELLAVPGSDTNPVAIAEMATTNLPRGSRPAPPALPATAADIAMGTAASSAGAPAATSTSRTIPLTDIGEVELAYHVEEHRKTPRSISTTAYSQRHATRWQPWAVLAAILLAAAGGGWFAVRQLGRPQSVPTAGTGAGHTAAASLPSPSHAVQAPAAPATSTATGSPAGPGAGSTSAPVPESSAAVPPGTNPGAQPATTTADPATGASPVAPAEPPAEVAPEPPPKATLRLLGGWSDAIVVHGVGRQLQLGTKDRSLELEAGTYDLMFELLSDDYSDVAEVRVTLEAGKTKRLACPLPRPGRLSVQPFPDTPQGRVSRGTDNLGPTPILNRQVRPGTYVLTVVPLGSGSPLTIPEVVVESNAVTTVSFDLTGRRQTSTYTRPLAPGDP